MKAGFILLLVTLSFETMPSIAQDSLVLHLSREENGLVANHPATWRYFAGDHPQGAAVSLDETGWERIRDTSFDDDFLPASGWTGIGWFRLHFTIDSSLVHVPLAIFFGLEGAAEIYLNGRLIDTYGQVGATAETERSIISEFPNPKYTPVTLSTPSEEYVLAVRHSNVIAAPFRSIGSLIGGFGITIGFPDRMATAMVATTRRETAVQFAFTCFPAAFALIFGLLFAFHPTDRQYLYFALLSLGVAGMTFVDLQLEFLTDSLAYWSWRRWLMFFNVFTVLMLLHTVHDYFYESLPRQYYVLAAVGILVGIAGIAFPFTMFRPLIFLGMIVLAEIVRVIVLAIHRRHPGGWLLGIGIILFIAGIGYDLLLDLGLIGPIGNTTNGYFLGFMGLLVAMAVYLGRRLAQTHRHLSDQIVTVQTLSEKSLLQEREAREQELERMRLTAENERKQLELEKAKELEASFEALEEAHRNLKATQAQLIHAEKMASLGQMAAGIAHEIKNPLNFVNNFARLNAELAEDLHSAPETGEDPASLLDDMKVNASKIVEHSQRASDIVTSMMRHASGAKTTKRPTDVNQLVQEYVNLAYHGIRARYADFNVTIDADYSEQTGEVVMAPQEIGQVLINLFNNAFDAMREKPASHNTYQPRLGIETRRLNDAVEIVISDNGVGIPPETRNKIFDPFFTTKPAGQGTGLGLSLSYEIVVQGHDGQLTATSEPHKGSVFTLRLPV